jgi:hypothetical protein
MTPPARVDVAATVGRNDMRKCIAVSMLGLAAMLSAVQAEPLATAGIGLQSCEKLATDLKPEQGFNHLPNALMYYWVQGYMSAANMTMLESDSEHVDLSKFDEKVILPAIHEFCTKNPGKKPISLIDQLIDDADKIQGAWTKGTVKWAAE